MVGWQTLTWTFTSLDAASYNRSSCCPTWHRRCVPGKNYYFDDINLWLQCWRWRRHSTPPGADMGSGGPQTLTIATGDVKTGDGGNTMFVAGRRAVCGELRGQRRANATKQLAAWPGAKTANFGSITGISGGDIGYFQDDAYLSNSAQKLEESGWVAGTALAPAWRAQLLPLLHLERAASSANSYMGLYANAPNNGTVDVSTSARSSSRCGARRQMYQNGQLQPDPGNEADRAEGCRLSATGSGATEIKKTLAADQKIGAGSTYKFPLAGWTVIGVCGTDSGQRPFWPSWRKWL